MKHLVVQFAIIAVLAVPAVSQQTRGVRILPADKPVATATAEPTAIATPHSAAQTAVPQPVPVTRVQPCTRAFPQADLKLEAGAGSRRKLRDLLSRKPARVVVDAAPFEAASPPAMLAPWLTEIQASGGTVGQNEIRCTRGFSLSRLFSSLFGRRDPELDYAAVRGYDAVLWIDANEKLVRQVEFRSRNF